MATIKISDLHSVELEHQFTALTDDELANIQGGGGKHRKPKPKGNKRKKIGKGLAGLVAGYVVTPLIDKAVEWWNS